MKISKKHFIVLLCSVVILIVYLFITKEGRLIERKRIFVETIKEKAVADNHQDDIGVLLLCSIGHGVIYRPGIDFSRRSLSSLSPGHFIYPDAGNNNLPGFCLACSFFDNEKPIYIDFYRLLSEQDCPSECKEYVFHWDGHQYIPAIDGLVIYLDEEVFGRLLSQYISETNNETYHIRPFEQKHLFGHVIYPTPEYPENPEF